MADADIDNIPTCGLVELNLPVEQWSDVMAGGATLVDFDYPKKAG
jgi:phosphohistidine phosphatase